MVCRHKEVISAYVGAGVEGWTFGFDVFCQVVPLELCFVSEFSPGSDGSSMDAQLVYLVWGAREGWVGLDFVVTFPVAVVEGDVAY